MSKNNLSKELPNKFGVYLFKDENNEIIYIGKANDLKKRVSQYFSKSYDLSPKTKLLVSKIKNVDFQITSSEIDALLLESNLINKYEPKYNIRIKRSYLYPYIEVTKKLPIEIKTTRVLRKNNSLYFGPFPDGYSINKIINIIKEIYPFNKCLNPNSGKQCIYSQMNLCIGYCYKNITLEDYDLYFEKIKKFLSGNVSEVENLLKEKIDIYSKKYQFEHAKKIKDYLDVIEKIKLTQKIIFQDSKHRDVIGLYEEDGYVSISILNIRFGKAINSSNFSFQAFDLDHKTILRQFLVQFYKNAPKPDFLSMNEEFQDLYPIVEIDYDRNNLKLQKSLLNSINKEAQEKLKIERVKIELKNKKYESALSDLKEFVKLTKTEEIEMIDISSFKGENQVGVVVNFKNGIPNKNFYRKYSIKSIKDMNDYASIEEVTYRHFRKKLLNKDKMPDLLLIDGKQQAVIAKNILNKLKIDLIVVGVIKDLKHHTNALFFDNKKTIELNKKSSLWEFISQIQDEVHRFAITFHKKQREKSILKTSFSEFTFLTKEDIDNLFREFGTIRQIKISNLNDLIKVIGKNKGNKLLEALKKFDS